MEKLNQTIQNGATLQNTFLNNMVSKINELVDNANSKLFTMMPQPVYDYLKANNLIKPGFIGTYAATMDADEIELWILEYYS